MDPVDTVDSVDTVGPGDADVVLTAVDLRRAVIARQHLATPSTVPLAEMLDNVGGLQAQYAPSMYIGCWSRLAGFRRDRLHGRPRGPPCRPGHAAPLDDPPGVAVRLLAAGPGRPRRPPQLVGAGCAPRRQPPGDAGCGRPRPCGPRDIRRAVAQGAGGGRRPGPRRRCRALPGPGEGPAVGHVGAAACRSVRRRRRRGSDRLPTCPEADATDHLVRRYLGRLRAGDGQRDRLVGGPEGGRRHPGHRSLGPAPVPQRGRQGPRRSARPSVAGRGRPRPRPLHRDVGGAAAGPRPAGADPAAKRTARASSASAHHTRSTRSSSTASSRARGGSTPAGST